jgi:hypothetical protein
MHIPSMLLGAYLAGIWFCYRDVFDAMAFERYPAWQKSCISAVLSLLWPLRAIIAIFK